MNTFWDEADDRDLSNDAVLLYIWSWTNQKCGMAGIYRIARRKLLEGRLDSGRLDDALQELAGADLLYYQDGVLWNPARVKRLSALSDNIAKSIANDVNEIGNSHPLVEKFLGRYGDNPKIDGYLTVSKPSSNGSNSGSAKPNSKPSRDGSETVPGHGHGSGQGQGRGEWEEWLEHYRETTGRSQIRGSKPAKDQFAARRKEGYSLGDLKLATVGCHGDDFCHEKGYDVPETILRASKVTRYIELGRKGGGGPEVVYA